MSQSCEVAIVGAGPAGAMLAIELGCRGIRTVVLEEDLEPPSFPKANATSARTMEHFRRRGFAQRVRACGLPANRPQDVVYRTRVLGEELARFRIPAPDQAARGLDSGDYGAGWPTPELPHRGNQMFIEPILLDELRRHSSVSLHLGARVSSVEDQGGQGVILRVATEGGEQALTARYVVGCDGPRSIVREAMGVNYEGRSQEQRDFFGGQMLTIFVRSAQLSALLAEDPAWTYWVINPQRRGVLIAIDGRDQWVVGVQLMAGQTESDVDIDAVVAAVVGRRVDFELIGTGTWLAGYMLVAERLHEGRMLIAGDAAHLFTPVAGMGYNTSIDDAVNLGWKLAACLRGWGGADGLLASYDAERRPIARRNTAFARAMADSMGALASAPELESTGPEGASARAALGARCRTHIEREFNIPGLQLGVRYESPIVAREPGEPPADDPHRYRPSGWPGARAPHVPWDGASLLDRLGLDFTLLCTTRAARAALPAWHAAAAALGMPLAELLSDEPAIHDTYGAALVLIRPDGHIAWRGVPSDDPATVLAAAVGRA